MRYLLVIFAILFVIFGVFYYRLTGNVAMDKSEVFIVRAVDGDTLETSDGQKIRLLGINTPEKGMLGYEEAKIFTRNLAENKSVKIETIGVDKYGRILAHVFVGGQSINQKILKNGLGSLYYYEKDKYYNEMQKAEEFARVNNLGIWKESKNKNCIELIELKYIEDGERCTNREVIRIKNSCSKEIMVTIKDDATHIYDEKIKSNSIFSKNFSCIWNDEGDSLFVWDDDGLILFYRYPDA